MTALTVSGSLIVGVEAATAGTECQVNDPQTGTCVIRVEVDGPDQDDGEESSDGGSGSDCFWDGERQGVESPARGRVPCTTENGNWSNSHNCYFSPLDEQPPAGDPAWQGHEPGDGAVYTCTQPQTGIDLFMWAADQPVGGGLALMDVAQMAIDSMDLKAIDIGITPEPGPDSIGVVGMPVWMWVDNPDSSTYGPANGSASAGGITITATARVQRITWDMGDGTTVVCRTPGMPYEARFGKSQSPDCGHVYQRSSAGNRSEKYTVTATSSWLVEWEGAGQSGTIPLDGLQQSVAITIGEGQVLVR